MKKALIFFLLIVFMLLIPIVRAPVLEGWKYSKILEFSDGSAGLQVNFNVTFGAAEDGVNFNSQEDFADLRFYDLYTGVLLAAWNQTTVSGEYVNVWLKLDESLSVIMYYGEDSAEPYWNITAVFEDVIGDVVLALPMDEGSGSTVYDYSGNNFTGSITGTPSWINGVYGSALNFTGNYYTSCGNHPELDFSIEDFSISMNFRPVDGTWCVLSRYNTTSGKGYYVQRAGRFLINDGTPSFADPVAPLSNQWYSMAFVCNRTGGQLRVFTDSVGGSTTDISGVGDLSAGTAFYLGMFYNPYYTAIHAIDNFVVYSKVLSISEIGNLSDFYGDPTIVEGSVCCRVWFDPMPSASFGDEVSRSYASRGEFLAAAAVAILIFGIGALLILVVLLRRR